jgi:molybdopterin-guanine dinucleotide biosynthesis protein A
VEDVTAFVLAGGKSSRMGQDKVFLKFHGRTLLERALELAGEVTEQVRIVGAREKFATFAPVVEDVYAGRGPLAGIHAALSSSQTELNLVLAVDTPFLQSSFLKWLVAQARNTDALATVPSVNGQVQPLCAVYRRGFGELAERALQRGENKIGALFEPATTRVITETELSAMDIGPTIFDNLNTREEFEQARHRNR